MFLTKTFTEFKKQDMERFWICSSNPLFNDEKNLFSTPEEGTYSLY